METELKLLVIDVDGTMTDGGIYYDAQGNELKKFSTRDAAGFFAARWAGIKIMVLTGRECAAVTRRMEELKVDYLYQNVRDKHSFLEHFMITHEYRKEETGYIGDDLNDLTAMKLTGFKACPKDSCTEVKAVCDYISTVKGGEGAVRDIIEHILIIYKKWEMAIMNIYCPDE